MMTSFYSLHHEEKEQFLIIFPMLTLAGMCHLVFEYKSIAKHKTAIDIGKHFNCFTWKQLHQRIVELIDTVT